MANPTMKIETPLAKFDQNEGTQPSVRPLWKDVPKDSCWEQSEGPEISVTKWLFISLFVSLFGRGVRLGDSSGIVLPDRQV